jgi:hypothetical protein
MKTIHQRLIRTFSLLAVLVAYALLVATPGSTQAANAPAKQKTFATPQEAMAAFEAAVLAGDIKALRPILGAEGDAILASGDPVEDRDGLERFSRSYKEAHKLDESTPGIAWIVVGKDEWPLPIPIVKKGETWYFDSKEGKEELLNRRIGRNELWTIQSMLAYMDAQQEYYQRNPQGDKLLHYAQKFGSAPGKRDGLYFPTEAGELPSPLGPLFAKAKAAGYGKDEDGLPDPYFGYRYRILKRQGPDAPGGAYDYVVQGRMIGGFALIAWPASYGNSGVMTFIVNHEGVVYEKDLGPETAAAVGKITRFNPDKTWKRH